jgi:putative colanic acid biosynthesis acetyltransferase WcaF
MSGGHGILPASAGSRRGGPSFGLRHRLERVVWGVAWTMLARWTPPPLYGWRRLVLNAFGARLAPNARVYGSARIWYPRHLAMAENAVLGPGVICYSMAPISIGRDAVISQRAHLCAGTHAVDDPLFQLEAHPIVIEAKAWVAAEAFVGPGVTVHEGAVLGARGVTMRDLPAWTISAGNPARLLRERRRF